MINVLTYCGGYPVYVYERFINTLFADGFDGMLYMFMKEKDLVKVKPFVDKYINIECIVSDIATDYCTFRFEEYKQFLDKREFPRDSHMLICDSRDVLFQRNINEIVLDPNKEIFVSFQPNEKTTMVLMKSTVKDPLIDKYSTNTEICCGTIISTYESTKKYLDDYSNILKKFPRIVNIKTTAYGVEQMIINYLVYCTFDHEKVDFLTNDSPIMSTLGQDEYVFNDSDEFVTNMEQVYYIVHQYDRTNKSTKRRLSLKHKCNFLDYSKKGCVGVKYQEFLKSI